MRTIHSHHARSWTGSPTLENSQSTTATAVKLRHQRARCSDQIAVDDDRVVGLSCNGVQFAKDPAAGHPEPVGVAGVDENGRHRERSGQPLHSVPLCRCLIGGVGSGVDLLDDLADQTRDVRLVHPCRIPPVVLRWVVTRAAAVFCQNGPCTGDRSLTEMVLALPAGSTSRRWWAF